ncbi:MAG TPA: transaldolase [Vicinamibacteria bacterium]|nr:transaldolase [Vicinamibacteria bacterium]
MTGNALKKLAELGQSVWYDYIRRDLYQGGELQRLIQEDGLSGMTSNPTIFQKAIAETGLYDDAIRRLSGRGLAAGPLFEALEVEDVRAAADVFRPVFERAGGDDGFVSIEVNPALSHDTSGTIDEARRLWQACDRPNVMVKIPGTSEGISAIRACLAEGININITLLFSVARHREVMEAYLSAMEQRVAARQPADRIRSIASFFVSRVDTLVDRKLDTIASGGPEERRTRARALRGKIGIANARLAYEAFEQTFAGARWAALAAKGVRRQRPLWASTSTKDPAYPPLYYVEALVAPDSVDTMPPETYALYRKEGKPQVRIHDDLDGAREAFRELAALGIEASAVADELEKEGEQKFVASFEQVVKAVEEKKKAVVA